MSTPHGGDAVLVPYEMNLILCRYAERTRTDLNILGAGQRFLPPEGRAWFMAGTADLPSEALTTGLTVLLLAGDANPVVGPDEEPVGIKVGFATGEDVDAPGRAVRIPLVLELPVPDFLDPGIYVWRATLGDMTKDVPFIVRERHGLDQSRLPQDASDTTYQPAAG